MLALAWVFAAAGDARGMCDVIPGVTSQFRSALGSLDRPFAIPGDVGQQLTISLGGCDAASPGFVDLIGGSVPEDDYFVSIVFKPPGGATNAVVLTTAANASTCGTRVSSALPLLGGGSASCRTVTAGSLEYSVGSTADLSFRFPDTDAELAPDGDDRTYTGPAAVAVTPVSDSLPFGLASTRCADTAGLVACIDELYARDGTCETTPGNRDPVFGHFTGLPPANDYEALCKTPSTDCDGTASELRLTVDADGHALIPIDWRGVLIRSDGIPIARLASGTSDYPAFSSAPSQPIVVPGESFLASYAPGGQLLPPIFTPLTEDGATDLSLFGSVDAPVGVMRLARRAPDLSGGAPVHQQCTDLPDTPCALDSDCPTGTCGGATCRGGPNDGNACTGDGECPSGECGPGLFDLSDRLDGGVGPVLVSNTGSTLALEATSPVPIEGLVDSPDLFAFVQLESVSGTTVSGNATPLDLNGDSDTVDSVLVLRDRASGTEQVIGEDFGGGAALGRAVARLRNTYYNTAALAVEGDVLAFLEPEPHQGDCSTLATCDHNGDGDDFDTILRVYELGTPTAITDGLDEAVDAAGHIDGRALRLSDGLVFYRQKESDTADQVTRLLTPEPPTMSQVEPVGSAVSPDGRFVALQFNDFEELALADRDTDTDGIFDEAGATSFGSVATGFRPRITPDGRYLAYANSFEVAVYDTVLNQSASVSVSTSGDPGNGASGQTGLGISADGRYVVFDSSATNFATGDLNGNLPDIFLHDRDADTDGIYDEAGAITTQRVNTSQADTEASFPDISADGRHIVYHWSDFGGTLQTSVRAHDRDADGDGIFDEPGATLETEVVVTTPEGRLLRLSANGRHLVFATSAAELVPGDTNNAEDPFLHDRDADEDGVFDEPGAALTRHIARRPDGSVGQPFRFLRDVSISPDGRYATFDYTAGGLVPREQNGCVGVTWPECTERFRYDRITRFLELVSVDDTGQSTTDQSYYGDISEDGRYVTTSGQDLAPGGASTEVFVRGPDPADLASDLTGDSDLDDNVLRVLDARVASPVPLTIAPAGQASIAAGSAAFLSPERATGADLNLDSDADDEVVHLYRNRSGTVNLERAATRTALSARFVAAQALEGQTGSTADLNGDGDQTDAVLLVNPTATATSATWTNVGIAADQVAVIDTDDGGPTTIIALRTPECAESGATTVGCSAGGTDLNGDGDAADGVLHIYRPDLTLPASLVSTGLSAEEFVLGERVLAFRTAECSEGGAVTIGCAAGGTDLNGDGDAADSVMRVIYLPTGEIFDTGQAAVRCPVEACDPTQPYRVEGDIVTFVSLEAHQGATDMNGDGDATDLVVQIFNAAEASNMSPGGGLADECVTALAGASAGICTDTGEACGGDAECASGDCFLPPGRCIENVGPACTDATDCGAGEFCFDGSCHVEGGSACGQDADCPVAEYCIDESEDGVSLLAPVEVRPSAPALFASAGAPTTELTGGACISDTGCPAGEVCGEAGRCIDDRSEVRVASAADADGDGVPDPFDNCERQANADQADLDEDLAGDICDRDRDGDDLLDVYETDTGTYVSPMDTGTSPALWDTDGDGFGDGEEVAAGSDPNDANDFPALAVPLLGPLGAAGMAVLLAACGAVRLRRRARAA